MAVNEIQIEKSELVLKAFGRPKKGRAVHY
jgi:hypothetical protein